MYVTFLILIIFFLLVMGFIVFRCHKPEEKRDGVEVFRRRENEQGSVEFVTA